MNKNRFLALLLPAALTSLLLAACGGDNSISNVFGAAGKFRVVNGISDSTSIDVSAPNVPSDLNNIAVNSASGFRTVPASSFNVQAKINTSSGSQPTYTLNNVQVSSGQETTTYFTGKISDGSYASASGGGFFVQNGAGSIASGNVEVTAVHAASAAAQQVNIYVTAPTAAVPATPTFQVNYKFSGPVTQIAGGSYRIRVSLTSAPTTIVFDSGTTGITLAAGQRLQIAALNETDTTKNSPILLYVIPSDGSAATTLHNGG